MKKMIAIFLVLFSVNTLFAQDNTDMTKSIHVTGTAEKQVEPDELYFRIILDESEYKASTNIDEVEQRFVQGLSKMGIPDSALTILDYSSRLDEHWFSEDKVQNKRVYNLLLHDTKTAKNVYKLCKEFKISQMDLYKTDYSKMDELKKEVNILAIKAAKAKAQYMLEAIDEKIGQPIIITMNNNDYYNSYSNIRMDAAPMMSNGGSMNKEYTPPSIRKITVKASFNAQFEIVSK